MSMRKILLPLFLLLPTSALAQSWPSDWKSYTQTGNPADIVPSTGTDNSVAAWFEKKVDVTNGAATGLKLTNGSATGTDISAAISSALNGAVSRSLATHFADTLNLADYGVVCDGITDNATTLQAALTAAATNSKYSNGVEIVVPFGICYSSAGVNLTPTDTRSFGMSGAGMGASTLQFASGGLSVTINGTGAFSGSLFHIQRNATTEGDTGVLVTGTNGGVNGTGQVGLNSVRVDGVTRANSYATGIHILQASINANNIFTQLADSAADTAPTLPTIGLDIEGTAGQDVAAQSDYLWSIDNKITNSTFQGGYNGIHVHGAVQGVFVTNSEALGNTKALNWEGGGYNNFPELLYVSNFHGNAHICDVCTSGQVNQITVTGSLLLHFNDSAEPWSAISLSDGQQAEIQGNTGNTSGTEGTESLVSLTNFNFSTVTGNSGVTINGPVIALLGTSSFDVVTGNMANTSGSYAGAAISGCYDPSESGARYRQCFNNLQNTQRDIYVDNNQSLHLFSAGTMYLDTTSVKVNTLITDGEVDSNVGTNLYRLLYSSGITSLLVCPDNSSCTIGNTSGTTTINGSVKVPGDSVTSGNSTSGVVISTGGEFDANVGGNQYRMLYSSGISETSVCPDTGSCALGNASGALNLIGMPILPSKAKAAILALSSPVEGEIVNDNTDNVPVIYENGSWYPITLGTALSN